MAYVGASHLFFFSMCFGVQTLPNCCRYIYICLAYIFAQSATEGMQWLANSALGTILKLEKRTVRATKEMTEECKKLLDLMGVPGLGKAVLGIAPPLL